MTTSQPTLLWHDYETWGVSPSTDRPAQFAAIRTDLELNPVGRAIDDFCRLSPDYLPKPEAMLVTGISPQKANEKGYIEAEFMARINGYMSEPETCVVGYNSIRFDDEVTRYSLYRNFFDPYQREYSNNNSRWDIIDLVRACYALRPEGIEWPINDKGHVSFRLELLTAANGIGHTNAHDALSDVEATIALAKLIKQQQPKLYDYAFNLRRKQAVAKQIDVINLKPLLHISSKFSPKHGCASLVVPICYHPTNNNAIVLVDLCKDITPLLELTPEQIIERLYTPHKELQQQDLAPVPLKLLHLNKCPFITTAKSLTDEIAARLQIDKAFARVQYQKLKQAIQLREKISAAYDCEAPFTATADVDAQLYNGFPSHSDKAQMEMIRRTQVEQLAALTPQFDDAKYHELFFRYKARNYPQCLSENELFKWRQHCEQRLNDPDYLYNLENLVEQNMNNPHKLGLLKQLYSYLQSL
ncbi:exodeoxyribonuclease I [Paraferrimonas sp. SM1919]|uniref:exodeoxyribonuclease I n=1 Tax=Paraferrimonas sp. SM1919 TaxID=2662263 RepID=UPI0013D204F5|nr:exodeoxyribonuclease I [Paraferrimonas sp. SM1919]